MLGGWAAATLVSWLGTGHSCLSLWAVQSTSTWNSSPAAPAASPLRWGQRAWRLHCPLLLRLPQRAHSLSHLPSDALAGMVKAFGLKRPHCLFYILKNRKGLAGGRGSQQRWFPLCLDWCGSVHPLSSVSFLMPIFHPTCLAEQALKVWGFLRAFEGTWPEC